jgi:ABC-type multidrug transport system fused ATPase/permease subunit
MDFNSVERAAVEYTQELEQEKEAINPDCRPPSASWPAEGEISVSNLRLCYPGTETDVLQDVSFHIPPRTKVGVVGRTGAGKTSLIAALFRLVEPKPGSGLVIDGQDILQLGLEDLRGRLAIVPQESMLFRGTIRSNLDPFGEFSDVDLWAALEKAQLKGMGVVKSLEDAVAEGGSNFSVGERALLCFGRALLRTHAGGRGVLVLDEATASVDPENDARIQEMMKTQLSNVTVVSVAHRLRTVAFYDLVLVLQQGQVLEYGPPLTLLEDPQSAFRAMAQQTGEFEALVAIAKKATTSSGE